MIRRRIPFTQIAFVTLIGVGGGVYIYRPYFVNNMKTQVEQNQNVPKKQSDTWLLIILKKNKAELYDGPSELEAKLLRMWDMKFIECWLLNKQLRVFWLASLLLYFFIVLYINLAQAFCQDASWTAPIDMFQVAAGRDPRRLAPERAASTTETMYTDSRIEGFLTVVMLIYTTVRVDFGNYEDSIS